MCPPAEKYFFNFHQALNLNISAKANELVSKYVNYFYVTFQRVMCT